MQFCPQEQASQDKSTGRRRHQGVSLPRLMGHTQGFFAEIDGGHSSSPRGVRFLDMSGNSQTSCNLFVQQFFHARLCISPLPK